MGKSLVYGIGINDAYYPIKVIINKKQIKCAFYTRWQSMIQRCYSPLKPRINPTYADCTVCEDWLTFSNFKSWMEKQDWEDKHLDKDLLFVGNKVYSAATCVFVSVPVNIFTTDRACDRGDFPLGVSFDKSRGRLKSYCNNPFTGKLETIGYFDCQTKAHLAWKMRKHELACQLADLQKDERVANALRLRYA